MENYRCAIIDDEDYAISTLTSHIKQIPTLELIKSFTDPIRALAEIKTEDSIDILFLDIDMPGLSGLELASLLKDQTKIIVFTTAYSHYAVDAFGIHADDYLVKPIGTIRFISSMRHLIDKKLSKSIYHEKDILFFRTAEKDRTVKMYMDNLLYIQAWKNYVHLHRNSQEYQQVKITMNNVERELANTKLMRVHRSYIVNLDKIEQVIGNTIKLTGNHLIPIGEDYKIKIMDYAKVRLLRPGRIS